MELLLSSYVLTGVPRPRLLPATTVTGRAGIILNALDQYGNTRDYALGREQATLESWGYRAEELDLRAYFAAPGSSHATGASPATGAAHTPGTSQAPGPTSPSGPSGASDALAARLADLDMVWALGGNVFVLARAMHAAGFHAALQRQAGRAEFVYGGYSAGACVAGPDLQGLGFVDDEEIVPAGYPAAARPVSLGLVPFRIVPHWRSDHPEASAVDAAAAWLARAGLAHRCLRDGEVVTRDGTVVTLV